MIELAVVVVVAVLWTVVGLWLMRDRTPEPVVDECCEARCGAQLTEKTVHVVTDVPADDDLLGVASIGGATAMSAAFCEGHCPGGCSQNCPP